MNPEFLAVLDYWEREKGISREYLLAAVEDALVTSAKKAVGPARQLRCSIDPKTGQIRALAKLVVVENVERPHDEISLPDARETYSSAKLGDEVEIEVTTEDFGRIASQYAKQSLMQALRRAEKQMIYTEFKDRVGDVVSGVVRRFERSDVIIDLGKFEATLPSKERVPTEEYQVGERLRCYVKKVDNSNTNRGPEIILSRADPRFVIKLFELEVTELSDGTIEIKSFAREAGYRTKLAVATRDPNIDPVGACVGLRGQRVKSIVRELNNEKVDVIRWAPNIEDYVANALAPAQPARYEVDEANRVVRVWVPGDQLSLAIGRRGQNARLTSRLTDWHVDIEEREDESQSGFAEKVAEAVDELTKIPGISQQVAELLVPAGVLNFETLSQIEEGDLKELPGLEDHAEALKKAVAEEMERRSAEA